MLLQSAFDFAEFTSGLAEFLTYFWTVAGDLGFELLSPLQMNGILEDLL